MVPNDRRDEQDAAPLRGLPQDGGIRDDALGAVGGGARDGGHVGLAAQSQRPVQQGRHGRAEGGRVPQHAPAAFGPAGQRRQYRDGGDEQQPRVLDAHRQRGGQRGEQEHRPAEPGRPDHDPGGQGQQEQAGGVVGGEVPQEHRRLGDREERRRAQADPLVEQPPGHRVQQHRGGQHLDQAQRPGQGQAAHLVQERGRDRVQHRGTGEVRRVLALQGRAVQQVLQFHVPGVQVERFVLEGRVVQPQRQHRLQAQDGEQDQPADHRGPASRGVTSRRSRAAGPA